VTSLDGVNIVKTRSGLRERTHSPNGGYARSGPNAWAGFWSSAAGIWNESFEPPPITTTPEAARGLGLKTPERLPDRALRSEGNARVRRRDLLGGLLHEYELAT
jgi:hypothetical protein